VPRTRKVLGPDGQMHDATLMTFRTTSEDFNEYLLDDNTVLKLKMVVTDVARIDGMYDQFGNPIYIVQSTNVLSVDAPDERRKQE
jgi:hypothetical protein